MRHGHVAHQVTDRLRLKFPDAAGDGAFFDAVARTLATLSGVRSVRVARRAESVVIGYRTARHPDLPARVRELGLRERLFELAVPLAQPRPSEATGDHSELAEVVLRAARRANGAVRRATDNAVDLEVLVPMSSALVSAVAKKNAPSPLWVTLLIFSFNAFVSLHSDPGAGPQASRAPSGSARS